MENTLQSDWFKLFRKKLIAEFGFDISKLDKYQPDMWPIIYCCLKHRRVSPRARKVILSKKLQENSWAKNADWLSLQYKIEKGDDINGYMSKAIHEWQAVDYLLYTCNISHFHLYKNNKGGIRDDLVFGVFTKDNFYALDIGNHKDIYKADDFLSIADSNWSDLNIFRVKQVAATSEVVFKTKDFKRTANDPNLQYNMIAPTFFIDHNGQRKELDNHQNTALVIFNLNGVDIGKIPFKVYCAYVNEIQYLEELDAHLYSLHQAEKMSLALDEKKFNYSIEIHLQRSIKKTYKIPKNFITCSLYENFKYKT